MNTENSGPYILAVSCFYHDSAACLLEGGNIVAAAQEERFSRKKHDPRFPKNAIKYCLDEAGLTINDIDHLVYYDKPLLTFERLLMSYLTTAPKGLRSWLQAMPPWLAQKLHIPRVVKRETGYEGDILFTEHHEAHAASAFYMSPFDEAAILTVDGVGEWATASYGYGRGNEITLLKELHFPDSLGLLYSAFTYFTGFRVNSGEYKLMGLAPYGRPLYSDLILSELIDLKKDGSMRLNQSYFDYIGGLRMTNRRFSKLFGGPPREPETEITQREMDIAASIQVVAEKIILRMVTTFIRKPNLTACAWPVASLSTASPTVGLYEKVLSKMSGSSRLPAMPAAPSERRFRSGTVILAMKERIPTAWTARKDPILGPRTPIRR